MGLPTISLHAAMQMFVSLAEAAVDFELHVQLALFQDVI